MITSSRIAIKIKISDYEDQYDWVNYPEIAVAFLVVFFPS